MAELDPTVRDQLIDLVRDAANATRGSYLPRSGAAAVVDALGIEALAWRSDLYSWDGIEDWPLFRIRAAEQG